MWGIGDALLENVISKCDIPDYIIMGKDIAFMSSLFNIKIKTTLYNHQSLQAEYGIKTISAILTKHLIGQEQVWPKYLLLATLAYSTFNSENLAHFSPYRYLEERQNVFRLRNISRYKGIRNNQVLSWSFS